MSERDEERPGETQLEPAETDAPPAEASLSHDGAAKRRRWARTAALFAAVAGLSALAVYKLSGSSARQPSLCKQTEGELAQAWNQDRKEAIRAAFLATKRPYAADTYQRVERSLDHYADAWTAMHADACNATQPRGDQSRSLRDRRVRCLDRELGEMAALIDVFAESSDPGVLDHAARSAAAPDDLARCKDTDALLLAVALPVDPQVRKDVQWAQTQVDRATALERLGKLDQALTSARRAAESARAIEYPPIRARALRRLGSIEARVGNADAAEHAFRDAIRDTARAGDDTTAADCWIDLVGVIGRSGARFDEALASYSTAEEAVARAGDRPAQRAALLASIAAVRAHHGDYDEALKQYERALSLTAEAFGPEDPGVATLLTALADVLTAAKRYDDARDALERALAITEKTLGPDHPDVARALAALANVCGNERKFADAEGYYRRALAVDERALGPRHPQVAKILYSLGVAVGEQGHLKDSLALFLRALEIQKSALGEGAPDTIWTINSIGVILQRENRLGLARARFREAQTLFENTLGKDHPDLRYPLTNLGEIAVLEGRYDDALALCQRAYDLGVGAFGADDAGLAHELTCLGEALIGLRRAAEAIAKLERALEMREANPGDPEDLADTRFALARALPNRGRDRARALELARLALADYTEVGESAKNQREATAAWLAAHSRRKTGASQ